MAIKVVILFQQTTLEPGGGSTPPVGAPVLNYAPRRHQAGWSESLVFGTDNIPDLINKLQGTGGFSPGLLPARAALMANGAFIVGVRLYKGGAGKGQSLALSYPSTFVLEGDNPQQALLCKCGSSLGAVTRRFTLRGIPDSQISQGEFAPNTGYDSLVASYFGTLGNFGFMGIDQSVPPKPIFTIVSPDPATPTDAKSALVTLDAVPNTFAVNDLVTFTKCIDATGDFVGGKFQVVHIGPGSAQFGIGNWGFGNTTKGTVQKKSNIFYPIAPSTCGVARLVQRKVGRPFELYRGRRSKRKKVA